MKKVILISAKAQHGKDSSAEILKKKLENKGERVAIMHFAKYIKLYLKDFYGWDGVTKDEFYRTKLQHWGTEKIRMELNMPHFHVNRVCEDIQILEDDFDYILIPDCRFKNEVYFTKACFPTKTIDLRVERIGFESGMTDEQKMHPSEIDLDDFNFSHYVGVVGGLDDLEIQLDKLFKGDLY